MLRRRATTQDADRALPAHHLGLRGQRRPGARRPGRHGRHGRRPSGTDVVVTMSYDAEVEIPPTPRPSIIAPSSSATATSSSPRSTTGGEVLADGASSTTDQTAVPLELDQIYASLDDLNVALGPNGANSNGALSDLLETTADELRRPGRAVQPDDPGLRQVHRDARRQQGGALRLRRASSRASSARWPRTTRPSAQFNQSLSDVSTVLEGEREELPLSLKNLGDRRWARCSTFVKENRTSLGRNIKGLNRVAKVLVKQRGRARRDPQTRPARAQQPGADLQPAGRHARHQRQPRRDRRPDRRPTRPRSCAASSARPTPSGELCDVIEEAAARGAGRARGRRAAANADRRTASTRRSADSWRWPDEAPRRSRPLVARRVGALLLTGCDFDVYELPLPGGTDVGDDPITVTAEFADVLDLVPQSTVKVNDVTVGKVTDIDLDGYTADRDPASCATTSTCRTTRSPRSARPACSARSSSRCSAARGRRQPRASSSDGDVIPLDRTGRNPEVEEVLGALSLLLNGGGVAQLKTIAQRAQQGARGPRGLGASRCCARSRRFMGQLDENKADIVDAIESLNRLADRRSTSRQATSTPRSTSCRAR